MINEELYISNKLGHRNPFKVPEGYFDQLCDQVMEKLPEEAPRTSLFRRMHPLIYAAACMCAVIFSATVYFSSEKDQEPLISAVTEASTPDSYLDEAADYAMVDNYEIYACLANE